MNFNECCRAICNADKTNPYARAYAQSGLYMTDPEEIRVQALYILNNIQHWRGENSKDVRAALKLISQKKQ